MTNAIRLRNINLHYASVAFRERSLKSLVAGWFGQDRSKRGLSDIHALIDITVEVEKGERIGLLGHNGAGKSSFLKMVAGLYPISSGIRDVRGTVRSMLDLSLGFEPDATGRENILYRGLLLGLSPRAMRSMEAEIVEFADLGEFIDYPLKTYSVGMQVRLAFAVSTAVGGDILLLDEVVGAGDARFMGKARARIMRLVQQSEIMILASHDLSTVRQLCQRGLVLANGRIVLDAPIDQAIQFYEENFSK
ncbi:MAG: ABC transporter ATP-binding protein [Mesorhizobium sp.]|nr:MAG: ABC transporter ATP-binding protein [Mesorhizobium sp.]TIV25135.1 MAG: ABC transporter ATP-binding protein [Mesorhizobium sp.]TIV67936.1 MAG: ABC transporter ATP-binding protein [Mesorhizobium sp.]TIW05651.1 MAG: ABC transporter ATP-binding protein [Mesorhizobium sp.]